MEQRDLLRLLIAEFQERKLPDLIPRKIPAPEIPRKIVSFVGMRRTGKTTFIFQRIRELLVAGVPRSAILYMDFEDDRLPSPDANMLSALVDEFYAIFPENHDTTCRLFLDDIQVIKGWEKVLRRLLDTRDVRITISGSSSRLLGREIATSLRGRSVAVEIWPFDFREFLHAREISQAPRLRSTRARDRWNRALEEYLKTGGFPEVVLAAPEFQRLILQEYKNAVVFRDLVERHRISNLALVNYLLRTLLQNPGGRRSVHKLARDVNSQGFHVSKNTLYNYLAYIEEACLAFSVPLFTDSERKRNTNPRKVYCVDPGMSVAFSVGSPVWGTLFENTVYLDLRRKGYDVFYYLTRSGREVDFVAVRSGEKPMLIQVCWDVSVAQTKTREEEALAEASRELRAASLLVTRDNYAEFLDRGLTTESRRHRGRT